MPVPPNVQLEWKIEEVCKFGQKKLQKTIWV